VPPAACGGCGIKQHRCAGACSLPTFGAGGNAEIGSARNWRKCIGGINGWQKL